MKDIFGQIKKGNIKAVENLLLEEPLLITAQNPPHDSSVLHYALHLYLDKIMAAV